MAGHVGRYAFINAKLRARLSTMLPEEYFERLEGSYSLADAFALLKETTYAGLTDIFDQTGDLKAVELELLRQEIERHRDLRRQTEEPVGELITAIELRYEVLVLKRAFRLWFDRTIRNRPIDEALPYLYRGQICYPIDVDAVVGSAGIEQIAAELRKTPYASIVEKYGSEVTTNRTLFPVEAALDRLYFQRLLAAFEHLDRLDREIAGKLIGIEIDIENINRLVRFKEVYGLSYEELIADLIPQGHRLGPKLIESIIAAPDTGARIAEVLGSEYPELSAMMSGGRPSSPLPARLLLIERVLEEVLAIEIRRVLAGYPFSIGIVIAYFLLVQNETKRIRAILNAKFYGRTVPQSAGKL